jgi:8-oxo-dGTP diphosphatase
MEKFQYDYPHPALTVDCVTFGFDGGEMKILLVKRGIDPFLEKWALPGGFVNIDEDLESCASRVLEKECGINEVYQEQLYTFGKIGRDPRERVVSVSYMALIRTDDYALLVGNLELSVQWFPISEVKDLAFDHEEILKVALKRLRGKIRYQPVGFELLNEKFTMPELQILYETILGKSLDRRNFYKKILATELLIKTNEKKSGGAHKSANYYQFDHNKYQELTESGINLEF